MYRKENEKRWLDKVFTRWKDNDQPTINTVSYGGCEATFIDNLNSINAMEDSNNSLHTKSETDQCSIDKQINKLWSHAEAEWIRNEHGLWEPPDDRSTHIPSTIDEYIHTMHPTIDMNKVDEISSHSKPELFENTNLSLDQIQSDSGANTSATNNIALLHNVRYIEPIPVNTATESGKPMQMEAIGTYKMKTSNNEVIDIACYYSPEVSGTIISPNAIVKQYKNQIKGYHKVCDFHNNTGYLIFESSLTNQEDIIFKLYARNNLWYHQTTPITSTTSTDTNTINKMSTAASYELWHQRLMHPGTNVMQTVHKHVKGVPKLNGNSFYKCMSCMTGKCEKSYHTVSTKKKQSILGQMLHPSKEDSIDDIHVPGSSPGQHFHFDFGFMRTKEFRQEDAEGNLQTSIDGKNAYLLVVDRATRYMWIYVSKNKRPPIEFCRSILHKFKSTDRHRTVRCDQGELATSKEFHKLLVEQGFILETTGAGNSKQNGIVERPHRTLANMVRCGLLSANLGPEFWSYALIHAVHIKNRLPHQSIGCTPYQALTGKQPDFTGLKIFGSRIVAHNTLTRTGKLDHNNVNKGIFLGYTGTHKNVWYLDIETMKVKNGSYLEFDEAHMSIPSHQAPLAAQALQRVGYALNEPDSDKVYTPPTNIIVHMQTPTAQMPRQHRNGSVVLRMDCDEPLRIPPRSTKLIQTGIGVQADNSDYIEIKPIMHSIMPHMHVMPGLVRASRDDEIFLIASNTSDKELLIPTDIDLALLHVHEQEDLQVDVLTYREHAMVTRSRNNKKIKQEVQRSNFRANKMETDMQTTIELPYHLNMSSNPYSNLCHRLISLNSRHDYLGMKLELCPIRQKPILAACLPGHPAAKIPLWRQQLRKAYVISVNNNPVNSIRDIQHHLQQARKMKLKDVKITFATLEPQSLHPQHGIPQLYHDQLNVIAEHIFNIQHEQPTSVRSKDTSIINMIEEFNDPLQINKVKKKFNTFTLRELKKRDDWSDWNLSIFKQLDQYHNQDTFGEPQSLPPGANLLSLCWIYLIKLCGTKKSRCVCNGSPRFRGTVTLAQTYASALDQVGSRIFWAAVALLNYVVLGSDASNAFAEAPPPKAPLYVRVDENYKRWYKHKFPERPTLPDDAVLRVKKALQGHPESPRLWATLIDKLLKKLNLRPCTHEPNLYYTDNYNGTNKKVLFLRQVDDFAIACEDTTIANQVINDINSKMTIEIKHLGSVSRFNGVDIDQRREYVKLHNQTYINKIIAQHQWLQDDNTKLHQFPLPMNASPQYIKALENAIPLEPTEKCKLEKKLKFSYRQAVGEIIYAMVTCRPDISFAIIKLSQYSARPAKIHYDALLHLYRYLKETKSEGIYYWREKPRNDLPKGNIPVLPHANNYDESQIQERKSKHKILTSYVDSDHASDSTHRRSVSGFHCTLAGGSVLFKTKVQSIVAQSSTEAEFIAAAEAAKNILYVRTILQEIGIPQSKASILYEDNQGALLMAQAGQPTKRTKHIDIKHFALQSWVEEDLLQLKRINTCDNSADVLTKATPRTIFYRHCNHILGKIIPDYVSYVNQSNRQINKISVHPSHQIFVVALNPYNYLGTKQGGM